MLRIAALAAAILLPTQAIAGTPSEAVAYFYAPLKYLPDIEFRERFVDPAKSLFAQNDKALNADEEVPCFEASPAIDAQDYDDVTVEKTLKLTETVSSDMATVKATFTLFPGPETEDSKREILWSLRQVNGAWLVSDLESLTAKWKLSDIKCEGFN